MQLAGVSDEPPTETIFLQSNNTRPRATTRSEGRTSGLPGRQVPIAIKFGSHVEKEALAPVVGSPLSRAPFKFLRTPARLLPRCTILVHRPSSAYIPYPNRPKQLNGIRSASLVPFLHEHFAKMSSLNLQVHLAGAAALAVGVGADAAAVEVVVRPGVVEARRVVVEVEVDGVSCAVIVPRSFVN